VWLIGVFLLLFAAMPREVAVRTSGEASEFPLTQAKTQIWNASRGEWVSDDES